MNGIYCGPPPLPDEIWTRWNLDPVLIGSLILAAVLLKRDRAGQLGIAVLAVVFVSPLCALSSALFSARVAHHVLLVAVAAPLIASIMPAHRTGSITLPFVLTTSVLWFWHLPGPYDLALANIAIYWVMQLSLIGSALWFWRAVLAPGRGPVDSLLFIFLAFAQMGMLGALLTFAPTPLYAAHAVAPLEWGLTPLTDQQLGGLVMWVPAALPYAALAILVARRSWANLRRGAA